MLPVLPLARVWFNVMRVRLALPYTRAYARTSGNIFVVVTTVVVGPLVTLVTVVHHTASIGTDTSNNLSI